MDIVVVNKGETIYEEGDISDSFYLIHSGKVEVKKLGRTLEEKGIGTSFGESGLIIEGERRKETLVCLENTTLLKISKAKLLCFR